MATHNNKTIALVSARTTPTSTKPITTTMPTTPITATTTTTLCQKPESRTDAS